LGTVSRYKRPTKYSPFIEFLDKQQNDAVRVSFERIEKILGFDLPNSARFPQWWSNNDFNSVFTKAWLKAGWRSKEVDVERRHITFFRVESPVAGNEESNLLDLGQLAPVAKGVLSVLARRSGRTESDEALAILNDHLTS
jgi:hypothetical protein